MTARRKNEPPVQAGPCFHLLRLCSDPLDCTCECKKCQEAWRNFEDTK